MWAMVAVVALTGLTWWALGWGRDVGLGVAAPVVMSVCSWRSVTRVWTTDPASSLAVMVRGFIVKAAGIIAWVAIALRGFEVRPEPFVVSLTVSFLALHLTEAWCLKRLMQT